MSQDKTGSETFFVQGSKIRRAGFFVLAFTIGGLILTIFTKDFDFFISWLSGSIIGITVMTWIMPPKIFSVDSEKIIGPLLWGWDNVKIPLADVNLTCIKNRTLWDRINNMHRIKGINEGTIAIGLSDFNSKQRTNIIQFLSELSMKR